MDLTRMRYGQHSWFKRFDIRPQRRKAGAIVFLRGKGHGRITSIQGLDEAQKKMGALVHKVSLPRVGALRQSSYEGDGWVIILHEDTEVVKAALDLIQTVQIQYQILSYYYAYIPLLGSQVLLTIYSSILYIIGYEV